SFWPESSYILASWQPPCDYDELDAETVPIEMRKWKQQNGKTDPNSAPFVRSVSRNEEDDNEDLGPFSGRRFGPDFRLLDERARPRAPGSAREVGSPFLPTAHPQTRRSSARRERRLGVRGPDRLLDRPHRRLRQRIRLGSSQRRRRLAQ